MDASLPVLAGAVSTVIFVTSTLPMLVKAARTKDLSSYSVGNILLSNVGNVVNTIYVVHLPFGPVWALHAFHLVTTGLMLYWYVRYAARRHRTRKSSGGWAGSGPRDTPVDTTSGIAWVGSQNRTLRVGFGRGASWAGSESDTEFAGVLVQR